MPLPPPFEARVVGGRALSPGVREIGFERTDGQPMLFEPGQWLNLILPAPGDLAVRVPFPRPAAGSIPLTRGYASTVTG